MSEKKPYWVEVRLKAKTKVRIQVWCTDDEEPSDLTPAEKTEALNEASGFADWEIESAKVVES